MALTPRPAGYSPASAASMMGRPPNAQVGSLPDRGGADRGQGSALRVSRGFQAAQLTPMADTVPSAFLLVIRLPQVIVSIGAG